MLQTIGLCLNVEISELAVIYLLKKLKFFLNIKSENEVCFR